MDNKKTSEIEDYIRKHLSSLSDNILNLCNNEYTKRWRNNHKDEVKTYNTEYYKKLHKIKETSEIKQEIIKKTSEIKQENITKANPLNMLSGRAL